MTTNPLITIQIESMLRQFEKNKNLIQMDQIKKYAVISTPRVGSTMLCKSLQTYGRLGNPTEWFNPSYTRELIQLTRQKINFQNYINLIYLGTINPENHIFGVNFHVGQYMQMKKQGMDVLSLGFDKIYYLERANKFAQAYSYAKGAKSKCWSKESESLLGYTDGMDISISTVELIDKVHEILHDIEYYEEHLQQHVTRSFLYEDFIQDNAYSAVTQICTDFTVEMPCTHIEQPTMQKQATSKDQMQLQRLLESLTSISVEG